MVCVILSRTNNSCYFFPHLKDSDAYQAGLIASIWIDINHLTTTHRVKVLKNVPEHRRPQHLNAEVFNIYIKDVLHDLSRSKQLKS